MWAVGPIVDTETGEILVEAGAQIGDAVSEIQASSLDAVEVVDQGDRPADSEYAVRRRLRKP